MPPTAKLGRPNLSLLPLSLVWPRNETMESALTIIPQGHPMTSPRVRGLDISLYLKDIQPKGRPM